MKRFKLIFILSVLLTTMICAACDSDNTATFDTSQRGNSDGNINNLGLSVYSEEKILTIGTENGYDLIFETNNDGTPIKAISGLIGYIQYLNIANDTCFFLGITYDQNEQRKESIFSIDLNGENQNCIYNIEEGSTVTYFSAVGDLLIFATESEDRKTTVQAINPTDFTEAVLFEEKAPIRSLQIQDGVFYYISDNTLRSVNMDGTNKTKIFKSSDWIGNMVIIGDLFYMVQNNGNDNIIAVNEDGDIVDTVYENGSYIAHMNVYGTELIFSDHNLDAEGNLKEAVIQKLDTETKDITELEQLNEEYTGIEICGDNIFIHLNDEKLTLKIVPIP